MQSHCTGPNHARNKKTKAGVTEYVHGVLNRDNTVTARRFPPHWSVEDIGAAFVVRDQSGQGLAYVYYEDEPGRRSAAKMLAVNNGIAIFAVAIFLGMSVGTALILH